MHIFATLKKDVSFVAISHGSHVFNVWSPWSLDYIDVAAHP